MNDLPMYEVRRVPKGGIRVDGSGDDPAWSEIEPMPPFMVSDGSGPAQRRTSVKIAWDKERLYFLFECEDPDIWGTMFERDDPIYEEEVVEAFIDPDSDLVRYYEIQTSSHGTLFDAIIDIPTGHRSSMVSDRSWTCEGWKSAVCVDGTLDNREDTDRGWTVEWAIPFTSLPGAPNIPPRDGDTWRINLYRIDRTPEPEYSCWSPTMESPANFHIPARFGKIIFRE